jgi:predicted secreted protein
MGTFAAIAFTCWLCALLTIPRRPVARDEGQELVYRRLVGRQQWLVACAVLATAVAAIALLRGMV